VCGVQEPAAPVAEQPPRLTLDRRRALFIAIVVLGAAGLVGLASPGLAGLGETWRRVQTADPGWLGAAVILQTLSLMAYGLLFQGIHIPPGAPIRLRDSYLITMAGLAATRLLSAGGAGGVALTAWALRRAGMARAEIAERMVAFLVLVYAVYAGALITCGVGLRTGVFRGPNSWALTILPAAFAAALTVVVGSLAAFPTLLRRISNRHAPQAPWIQRTLGAAESLASGIRLGATKIRRPDAAIVGALGWWALNIAVLYACFEAFGDAPPAAVLVQAFFVGMLANLLPLPGGIGGVDGGMVGAFIAFGVSGNLALLAVLSYRLVAFWLPTIPGVIAYLQLRTVVAAWDETTRPLADSAGAA
jgi:uncharacterized protein (TIRG00374 family)